jgi:GDP-4-dehydro-6-deoxy-D-mannose reductase
MMLPQWARQFALGGPGPVEVHTLQARLDLSDVRDVVRAYRLLVERGRPGEVYNVGSGLSRRSGEVFELLRGMADPTRPVVELQAGLKQEPIADVARLVRCTGWHATIPLETTISDTLAWWRQRCHMAGG